MNWYLTKLVFQIRVGDFSESQFDIQQRLVLAEDLPVAMEKARTIGRSEETSFVNVRGEQVSWIFTGVSELRELPVLSDGMQLCSATVVADNPSHFIREVRLAETFHLRVIPA